MTSGPSGRTEELAACDVNHSPAPLLPCVGRECCTEACVYVCMLQGGPASKYNEIGGKEKEVCKLILRI